MVLRCTARLLNLVGPRAPTQTPASDDDWYANLVWLDRRKCLLLMHAGTLVAAFNAPAARRPGRAIGSARRGARASGRSTVGVLSAAAERECVLGQLDEVSFIERRNDRVQVMLEQRQKSVVGDVSRCDDEQLPWRSS